MSWKTSLNSIARHFGLHLSRVGSVERLEHSVAHLSRELSVSQQKLDKTDYIEKLESFVAHLSSELNAANQKMSEARRKLGKSWFSSALEEVETRYSLQNGSFIEPDGVTHTFTNMEMESARFLYSLILLTRPKVIVETGTHQGYSATYVAAALRDAEINGKIWTIDPFEVSHLWDNSNLNKYVEWVKEMSFDAIDLVPQEIDFLILDSLHTFDTLASEIRLYEPRLKIGGVMFLHDTLVFPEMSPVVDAITASGRFDIVTLNTPRKHELTAGGSGITLAIKTADGNPIDATYYKLREKTARQHFEARVDYFAKQVVVNSPQPALDTYLK